MHHFKIGDKMSQNAIIIPETGVMTGLEVVEKINDALDTLQTQFSGPSAPSSPLGYQLWFDTTTSRLKIYDPFTAAFQEFQVFTGIPYRYLYGLELSNNVTYPNTHLDIAAGGARPAAGAQLLLLSASMTKRIDQEWAVGTGNGGIDTGSVAINTWYYIFVIRKDSDGTIDALFSSSASSPTMPSGYTQKRRIGCIRTDGSGYIRQFKQYFDKFWFADEIADVRATAVASGWVEYTLTVPPITGVIGIITPWIVDDLDAQLSFAMHGVTATTGHVIAYTTAGSVANLPLNAFVQIPTSGTSKIYLGTSTTVQNVNVNTNGWIDQLGR
jgi:hypothetical protein